MAFVAKKTARPGDPIVNGRAPFPAAPGGVRSPQIPGQVPDRSSVPDHGELPVAMPVGEVRRPLVEYGTSQRIMSVYAKWDGDPTDPARFEQATASYEELRKTDPKLRTPVRPTAGYALSDGTRASHPELAALAAGADSDFVDG
jgi:hypothetical protein